MNKYAIEVDKTIEVEKTSRDLIASIFNLFKRHVYSV